MRVNLLTDAPKHNLALMKISAWHKAVNDEVFLNSVGVFDKTYGSWLFDFSEKGICDIEGGPAISLNNRLSVNPRPDYTLYGLDFSLGYTWEYCPRKCPFCIVPKQNNPKIHHSIWEFHDPRFKKICLLNNNTFSDPQWKETFEEIWDADLIVRDENGYDLRLVDEEKATALAKTKWDHGPKFSWDFMKDEEQIVQGFKEINQVGLKWKTIYVLIGFDTTIEEDIYRCQKIYDMGHNPFPMIYENDDPRPLQHKFRRMIYARYYKKHKSIERAWDEYSRRN